MADGWIYGSAELAGMVFPLKASAAYYVLGSACQRGHQWPGSRLTLRRADKRAPGCRACQSKRSPWWLPFVDWTVAPVPAGKMLGRLCRNGHDWEGTGLSLRFTGGNASHCVICKKQRAIIRRSQPDYRDRKRKSDRLYAERNAEAIRERDRVRNRARAGDPQYLESRRAAYARASAKNLAAGLTARGTPWVVAPDQIARRPLDRWLRHPVLSPSVLELVENERRKHWREFPEDGREARRVCAAHRQWLAYQTRPDVRLAYREKSKRRKAQMRQVHCVKVSAQSIWNRFCQFDRRCAYCGAPQLGEWHHMDHFIPLAKGGTHVLGNLLPACRDCNFAKRDHDPERWFRAQPFFTEARWRKICQVLELKRHRGVPVVGQLSMV